jgi:hypothetical protein
MQDEARAANARVLYVDGSGVIRSLNANGSVAEIARMPFRGDQQEMSFAISPDGAVLEAAIWSLPPVAASPRSNLTDPYWAAGNLAIDTYQVLPQNPPTEFQHQEWTQQQKEPWPNYQAVAWDDGIVYTMPTDIATQQPYNGYRMFGPAVHFSIHGGGPSSPLGGSDCRPVAVSGHGVIACIDQQGRNPSVRKTDGTRMFAFPKGDGNYSYFAFSPSGALLAYFKFAQSTAAASDVFDLSGTKVAALSPDFHPRGWLDEGMVIGDHVMPQGGRRLAYVGLSDPSTVHDLPVTGAYSIVGAVIP